MRTVQPRLAKVGNIRTGDRKGTGKDPRRTLHNFRLTSPSKDALERAAGVYGGEVVRWEREGNKTEWQLYTKTNTLHVLIPHPEAITLAYEQWAAGGLLLRRCTGQRVVQVNGMPVDQECQCPDRPDAPCQRVVRAQFILKDLGIGGAWLFQSHGYNAAAYLLGVQTQMRMGGGDAPQSALLQLEAREQRRYVQGKALLQKFITPIIIPLQEGGYAHKQLQPPQPLPTMDIEPDDVREDLRAAQQHVEEVMTACGFSCEGIQKYFAQLPAHFFDARATVDGWHNIAKAIQHKYATRLAQEPLVRETDNTATSPSCEDEDTAPDTTPRVIEVDDLPF